MAGRADGGCRVAENLMKRTWIVLAVAAMAAASATVGHAQEDGIDKAKADGIRRQDVRRRPPGKKVEYACFVRRYDPIIWRGIPSKKSAR